METVSLSYPWQRQVHPGGATLAELEKVFTRHLDVLTNDSNEPYVVYWRNLDTGVEIVTQVRHRVGPGANATLWAECEVTSPHFDGVQSLADHLRDVLGDGAQITLHRRDDSAIDEFFEQVIRSVEDTLSTP